MAAPYGDSSGQAGVGLAADLPELAWWFPPWTRRHAAPADQSGRCVRPSGRRQGAPAFLFDDAPNSSTSVLDAPW